MTHDELLKARISLGLTQQQLSEKIGISREFIGMMEKGTKPISVKTKTLVNNLINDNNSGILLAYVLHWNEV